MNWGEFFAMNGYAWYIWGSYGMALLIFIIEIVMVRHKKTNIKTHNKQDCGRPREPRHHLASYPIKGARRGIFKPVYSQYLLN